MTSHNTILTMYWKHMKNNTFINISRSISFNLKRKKKSKNKIKKQIPYIWFFTDSIKTLNPINIATRLPNNSGIVIRSYTSNNKEKLIKNFRKK